MKYTHLDRALILVERSVKNYPSVVFDATKVLKDQAVVTGKSVLDLLRLFAKYTGIILFPLWIIPLAFAMWATFRVCGDTPPIRTINKQLPIE